MKIVYCIAGIYNSGGMERVLADKTNHLAEQGHDVYIITTDQGGRKSFFDFHPAVQHIDLAVNYDEIQNKNILSKTLLYHNKQRTHRKRLTATLMKLRPDITISMFDHEAPFLPEIHDGSKKLLEAHFSKNKRLYYGRTGLWGTADRWRTKKDEQTVKKYDKFIVLTHEDMQDWGSLPNMEVIPNSCSEAQIISPLKSKTVLAIGRLDHQKGFDRLINIWKKVAPQATGWQLKIVGSGSQKAKLQEMTDRYGLTNKLSIQQPVSNIDRLYADASILAMTSRYEGLPMVLIEAQKRGLPIIAYTCKCGPKDVITDGIDGLLIPEGQEDNFVNKLTELIKNKELRSRMGTAALKSSEKYSRTNVMRKWEEIFYNLKS